ncbi:FAD:protein FMN transferase, partial [Desulfovibrio oxamicus]
PEAAAAPAKPARKGKGKAAARDGAPPAVSADAAAATPTAAAKAPPTTGQQGIAGLGLVFRYEPLGGDEAANGK